MDNDAFRKIMATPRPHDSKPPEKFDKKSIRKLVDADLQRSKAALSSRDWELLVACTTLL